MKINEILEKSEKCKNNKLRVYLPSCLQAEKCYNTFMKLFGNAYKQIEDAEEHGKMQGKDNGYRIVECFITDDQLETNLIKLFAIFDTIRNDAEINFEINEEKYVFNGQNVG